MKNFANTLFFALLLTMLACTAEKPAEEAAAEGATDAPAMAQSEIADAKYSDIVRKGQASFKAGDIAGWMNNFSDDAVYAWNNGDSLAGKAAISEYWTKRMTETISSINFANEIYIPIKVNTPQSVEAPGVWVLAWYETTATYKATGKSMTQWIHSDTHFNADGKIDRVISYIDRAPITAAMTK